MEAIAGLAAILAFAFALLMHLAGWGSGKLDVQTFVLTGFLALALFVVWEPARAFVRRGPQ
jgi:hypothetical protein